MQLSCPHGRPLWGLAAASLAIGLLACGAGGPAGVPEPSEGRTPSGLAWDRAGSGPPIVLVHGAMLDRRQWNPQQPLTDHFTVIRYDTRWHGQSAGADSAFLAADDLAEVLDAAGVERASIVGLSNGARIAVDFALAYPSRVERLVLTSPGLGGYRPAQQASFWTPMMEALEEGDVTQAAVLLADSPVMHVEASDTAWVRAMVRDQAGVFSQDPRRELSSLPPAIRMLEMIRAPTLVISGESDLRDIVWTADTLEQGIVGSQRLIVPGARHLLNITHADQFNRAVIEFLVGRPR